MDCPSCKAPNPTGKKFCGDCGHNLVEEGAGEKSISSPQSATSGERRQVTVLFSDLAGYTAMTEKLDPEEVREVMGRVFGETSQIISRYGGVVEKYIGDAVMAVFGLNQALEDDAVRAVRAAWEIQQAVEELNPRFRDRVGRDLSMHTGINTGLVITGNIADAEGSMGIVGDAVNAASRLSDLAEDGQLLVGADTATLVERFFELEELSPAQVKGKSKAVKVFRVLEPRERPTATRRFAGLRAELVGRDVEMALLHQSTQRLRDGRGSIIALRGEAGTGKSRLVDEFRETERESHQWLVGNAYDHTRGIPYFPVVDMLGHAWGIEEDDTPGQVREKMETRCRMVMDDAEPHIPYLGALFSLGYEQSDMVSPEFRKQKIHEALLELFQALARQTPTVFFVEDMHWADPSTVEFFRHVLTHFQVPAITLTTYRPPFTLFPGDGEVPGYREMGLEILSASLVSDLTIALLDGGEAPSELQAFIQEKSGGNPFYVEEVLTSLMETDVLRKENGGWQLAGALDSFNVPGTLQGVIAARLDRLEPIDKKLLQEASVIGRNFFYEVLHRISTLSEDLHPHLEEMEGQDMIRAQAMEPDLEYMFKHPLTQEVVYNSLLIKDRQIIHERVGTAIEEVLAERLPEYYERLAHHFQNGQSTLKAVEYLIKAGEKSFHHYALGEAQDYFQQGFDLITTKSERTEIENDLLLDLLDLWGLVHYFLGTFQTHSNLLMEQREMVENHPDKARSGMFFAWLGWDHYFLGQIKEAHHYLSKALALAEEAGNAKVKSYVLTWLSFACCDLGKLDEGLRHAKQGHEMAKEFPDDHYLWTKSKFGIAWACWQKGDIQQNLINCNDLLTYSLDHSHVRGQTLAYQMLGYAYIDQGAPEKAIEAALEGLRIAKDPFYACIPTFPLIVGCINSGQFDLAEKYSREAVESWGKTECTGYQIMIDFIRGASLVLTGKMSQGMKQMRGALEWLNENQPGYLCFLYEGIIGQFYLEFAVGKEKPSLSVMLKNFPFLMKTLPTAARKAEHYLIKVVKNSREIGARILLAQALLNLGKLRLAKKRKKDALILLRESAEIFSETGADGFLQQTREVLAELEA